MSKLIFTQEGGTPSPPSVGQDQIYTKADNNLWIQRSDGAESVVGGLSITQLTGDVTATGPGSVPATVVSVGGSLAAAINTATILANNATNLNVASQIVRRDASGNFTAGTITANLTGNVSGTATNITASSNSTLVTLSALSLPTTQLTGTLQAAQFPALTGDITTTAGSLATTLATVNSNVGTFGSSTSIPTFTVNAKGLITAASSNAVIAPAGTLTGTTLAANVVSSSLTSVGTITSGTWNGTTIAIANGGTNSTAALNNNRIMVSSAGAIVEAAALTNGQLLVGSTGAAPVAAAITAGAGISVTNGAGSITVATTGLAATTTKTANYTILSTDSIIFCDTSGGAFTLTLPSPTALAGKIYRIIDTTGNFQTNNLTLARSSTEKIEGIAASKVLQTAWGFFNVVTNGTDWFVG